VRQVSDTTLNIPHPYPEGAAEQWIGGQIERHRAGSDATFAMVRRAGSTLIGAVGLTIVRDHSRAELGYWVGVPFWNQGFCTEAAGAVLRYAFEVLGLHRVHAGYFARNPASARVMEKIGMVYEGCFRGHVHKSDRFEDLGIYGALAAEWLARRTMADAEAE
jgi:RimJ/RimL family protein N-acetyltransferase